ncbi:hypothetical protein [Chroococcus sp. FPU101]|uniref:hypothetical protein n=1 Tax=Chroococcus sp. FPU101 TaxID=1974212 RepID=UPI001A8CBCD3|nr:hypothetical protein [Chroococcus sp. FPU101]
MSNRLGPPHYSVKFLLSLGYVTQALATQLRQDFGLGFFAKPRQNIKNSLMRLHDQLLACKRKGY